MSVDSRDGCGVHPFEAALFSGLFAVGFTLAVMEMGFSGWTIIAFPAGIIFGPFFLAVGRASEKLFIKK